MKEKKYIKIDFMTIVSVLTFIIMGLGATFAYFTASVKGEEQYVSVSSLEVILNLKIAPLYNGKDVLPTNDEDIEKAYKNKCLDYAGNGACFAYTIEIENKGYPQEGTAIFNATSDTITNLKYMIVSEGEDYETLKTPTPAIGSTSDEQLSGVPIKVDRDENKKVVIIIWISNLDEAQDEEQGGFFEGQVSFTSTSGAVISGTMVENVQIGEE